MTIRQRPIRTLPSPGIDAGPCAWKATPGRSASDLGNVEGPAPTSPATPPASRERAYPKGGDVPRAANGLKGGDRSLAQALETHRTPWKATQSADRRPSWQTLWKPGADESRHIRPPLEIENRTVDVPRAANGIEGREQVPFWSVALTENSYSLRGPAVSCYKSRRPVPRK